MSRPFWKAFDNSTWLMVGGSGGPDVVGDDGEESEKLRS